jgi:hypothetical protein
MANKNRSIWMDGYQAVGDWLGLRQERRYLPATEVMEESDDQVQA